MASENETRSAGGIIVRNGSVVLVSQLAQQGELVNYSFPKGHIEEGESALDAAYREIFEECGLRREDLVYERDLGRLERPRSNGMGIKLIHFYLFRTNSDLLLPHDANNREARWVSIGHVPETLLHPEEREFFLEHMNLY